MENISTAKDIENISIAKDMNKTGDINKAKDLIAAIIIFGGPPVAVFAAFTAAVSFDIISVNQAQITKRYCGRAASISSRNAWEVYKKTDSLSEALFSLGD